MRIEQLYHIIEINNRKSISSAAKAFNMSQPQLSNSVKNLETELGYKIFRRNNDGLVATSQGKEVLSLAREIINSIEEMKSLANVNSDLTGYLTLSFGFHVFNGLASLIMTSFHKRYPNVHLKITEDRTQEIIDKVAVRDCCIGTIGLPYVEDDSLLNFFCNGRNIEAVKMVEYKFYLMMGSTHPLVSRQALSFSDLDDVTIIDYQGVTTEFLNLSGLGHHQSRLLYVDNREVLKQFLTTNKGVTLLPDLFSYNDIYFQTGLLTLRPLEDVTERYKMAEYLIYSKEEPLSYLEKQLIRLINGTMSLSQNQECDEDN